MAPFALAPTLALGLAFLPMSGISRVSNPIIIRRFAEEEPGFLAIWQGTSHPPTHPRFELE
ncbi:hypothetical protein CFIMG_002704RA [Ceratocystis fimbriata CBS 114723]|uniref:Uncharacterized protein n=1 Tax=Ceratocystis fimbriata CBS 114723 TaxID=1035309 RepID=A0A2C5X3L5_9PEZI|nr:hypothetical protein CFIMG_002704RA [Ceratocystis fimbriata CBS 114723]